jgi:hypothetical protein
MEDIYLVLGLLALVVVLLISDYYAQEEFNVTVNNRNGGGYGRYGRYGGYGRYGYGGYGRYGYGGYGAFPYGYDYDIDDYPSPYYSSWYNWFNPYSWWY